MGRNIPIVSIDSDFSNHPFVTIVPNLVNPHIPLNLFDSYMTPRYPGPNWALILGLVWDQNTAPGAQM